MAVDRLELGVSVDEDDDAAGAGAETAERDCAGGAVGDAVSGHTARSNEKAGDLLHHRGHHRGFVAGRDRCTADH